MDVEEAPALHPLSTIPEESSLTIEEADNDRNEENRVKKGLEFEQLSSKSHQTILSFLPFHDLLNCRAVSKNLRSAVDKLVESKKNDQFNKRWNPYYSPRGHVDHDLNGEKVLGQIRLQSAAAVKEFLEKNGVKLSSEKPKVLINEPSPKPAVPPTPTQTPSPKKLSTTTQITQTPPQPPPVCPMVQKQQSAATAPQPQNKSKSPPTIAPSSISANHNTKISSDSFKTPSKFIKPSSPLLKTTNTTSSLSTSARPQVPPTSPHFKCEACLIPPTIKAVASTPSPIKSPSPASPKNIVSQSSPNFVKPKPTKSILVKQPTPFSPKPPAKTPPPSSKPILKPNSKASVISQPPPLPQQANKVQQQAPPPSKQVNKPPTSSPQLNKSQKSLAPPIKPQPSQQANKTPPPPLTHPPPQVNPLPSSRPPPPPQSRPVIVIPSISPPPTPVSLPHLPENPFPLGSVYIRRYIPDEDTLTTSSKPPPPEQDTNLQLVLRTTLLLKTFGDHLTSFTFDTGHHDQSNLSFPQLRTMLTHLPHLIFLSITAGNYEHPMDYYYTNHSSHPDHEGKEELEKFPKLPHLRYITLGYNSTYHLHMDILNAYGCQLRRFTCSKFGYFVRSPFGYHVSTNNSLHKLIDYVNSIHTLYPTTLSKLEELKLPIVSSQCLMREIDPIFLNTSGGSMHLPRLPIQWPHLKRLSLYYIHRGDGFNDCCLSDLLSAIGHLAPNLEELCLDFQACSDFIQWISSDPRPLQPEVYQPLENMKKLHISAISLLRADDMAGILASKFPNLENLTFFNWSLYYEEAIHGNNRQGRYYNGGPTPATIPGYFGYFWGKLPVLQQACVKMETWKDEFVYKKRRDELQFFEQKEGLYIY